MERRLVRFLIRTMKKHGWIAWAVHDGEEKIKCSTEKEVMDAVFSVDESTIGFKKDGIKHTAYIVLGNDGYDAICDYSHNYEWDEFDSIMRGEIAEYQSKLEEEAS